MAIPTSRLKAYEKTQVDLAIDEFVSLKEPTAKDINRIRVVAEIQSKLDEYRFEATCMSQTSLKEEKHLSSTLARRMTDEAADPKPSDNCDCHAIVSGGHRLAAPMRAILARFLTRIDDPRNGCWLPRTYDDIADMPPWLKKAVPHQGLLNPRYYQWLDYTIGINLDSVESRDDIIFALKQARIRLQSGALTKSAWPNRKG